MYRRGSLRETAPNRFAFTLQNPLGTATIIQPPRITVNGINYPPDSMESKGFQVAAITEHMPFVFKRGEQVTLAFPGHLLRGGNRIHISARTKEFGDLDIYVEDKEAEFCEVPGHDAKE